MMYKVFISYRRQNASDLGQLLYERLTKDGFQPFFDVEKMESGNFIQQLYDRIDECSSVIVLLADGSLDERPEDEIDFMRLEIAHALKRHKKIIPILVRDFTFPHDLPENINDIRYLNGVKYFEGYFEAAYGKLKEKLLDHASEPGYKPTQQGVCAVTGAFAGAVMGFIGRSVSSDAPALFSGTGTHALFVLALFGGVFGLAADMLIDVISSRANQSVLVTVGILLTLGAIVLTGLIPATVLQIITAAGCAAMLLKKLISG